MHEPHGQVGQLLQFGAASPPSGLLSPERAMPNVASPVTMVTEEPARALKKRLSKMRSMTTCFTK